MTALFAANMTKAKALPIPTPRKDTITVPETTQLHELPMYWQEQIRKLRHENRKMRAERNEARGALAALQSR
ncbi:hypothetical protein [Mycolicibacterium sp. XJ1904]